MKKIALLLIFVSSFSVFAQKKNEDALKMANIKATQTLGMIDYFYVDTADLEKLCNKGIVAMLKELDPHSVFIDKDEVAKMNEPLVGNFDGIGVSFQFMNDTIHVVEVISGGPSEKVGVLAGDKIIRVDGLAATGDTIKNDWVFKHVRGKKGTKVEIDVIRGNNKNPIVFNITRDKIPLNSIDTWFMIEKEIGYVKLDRFAQNSNQELIDALTDLKKQGMSENKICLVSVLFTLMVATKPRPCSSASFTKAAGPRLALSARARTTRPAFRKPLRPYSILCLSMFRCPAPGRNMPRSSAFSSTFPTAGVSRLKEQA
jgi:hypothetical protein